MKNNVEIIGTINEPVEIVNIEPGNIAYSTYVEVKRISGIKDIIPIIVSEKNINKIKVGNKHIITGIFYSRNEKNEGKTKLKLAVGVHTVDVCDNDYEDYCKTEMEGFLVKPPILRKTPFNKDIADLTVAVNAAPPKSYYIPCIVWGITAKRISHWKVGTKVKMVGNIQSRKYIKKISDNEIEEKTAYEFNVRKIKNITV